MSSKFNRGGGGGPCDGVTSHPGERVLWKFSLSLHPTDTGDKHQPDGPYFGSYADVTFYL